MAKKKLSLFGRLKAKAKRVKGLFRKKKKDDADHREPESEIVEPARDVQRSDTKGEWIVDVSKQFG